MSIKKRLRFRDLLAAALVILFSICVPVWLFVAVMIVKKFWLWVVLIGYVLVVYLIARRVECAKL